MNERPFKILKLDHLVLRTDDPLLLVNFYQTLGCEIVRDASEDLGLVQLRLGADGYGPAVYIKDPMGNRMELKGPPDPDHTQ